MIDDWQTSLSRELEEKWKAQQRKARGCQTCRYLISTIWLLIGLLAATSIAWISRSS